MKVKNNLYECMNTITFIDIYKFYLNKPVSVSNIFFKNIATGISHAFSLILDNSDLVNLNPTISDCFSTTGFGFLQAGEGCLFFSSS